MPRLKPRVCNVAFTVVASLIYYFFAFRHYYEKCAYFTDINKDFYRSFFANCGLSTSQGFAIFSNILTWLFIPLAYFLFSYLCSVSKSEK